MKFLNFLFFGVLAVTLNSVCGEISQEDRDKIKAVAVAVMAECNKEYGVTMEELKEADKSGNIDSIDSCFILCTMQKVKLINDEGLFDVATSEQLAKTFIPDGEERTKVIDTIETCKSVNEQEVSDGEKGCDRAKLLFECTAPFRKEFLIYE